MNTQIVVSSVTGNTLKVAKAIFESLVNSNKVDKCALVNVEDYKNSDVVKSKKHDCLKKLKSMIDN